MSNPRVYVGTYKKYNNGSTAGGWVCLLDCKDYQDFLRKCRVLHRFERDPEFMIQDTDDFPDGLDCMEWLSEQDFNDVVAACKEEPCQEGADTLSDLLRAALLRQLGSKQRPADDEKVLFDEYMQEWTKVWKDKSMLDYERKKFSGAVRIQNGGIVYFEKPSIENRFCFHDEGPGYDFYREVTSSEESLAQYFKTKNLADYDKRIGGLQSLEHWSCGDDYYGLTWYIVRESYSGETAPLNLYAYRALRDSFVRDNPSICDKAVKMTDADRVTILQGLQRQREKFEKRLDTYLKRYGVSKIHTWTYWADA